MGSEMCIRDSHGDMHKDRLTRVGFGASSAPRHGTGVPVRMGTDRNWDPAGFEDGAAGQKVGGFVRPNRRVSHPAHSSSWASTHARHEPMPGEWEVFRGSFHRDRLGQVARLVDVVSQSGGELAGEGL